MALNLSVKNCISFSRIANNYLTASLSNAKCSAESIILLVNYIYLFIYFNNTMAMYMYIYSNAKCSAESIILLLN